MKVLPHEFMVRRREIYFLIATADYDHSSTIQRDVSRTFSIFERISSSKKDVQSQQRALFRVLNAIAEAEGGYCQGMNFIAGLFLVEGLEEADAFALFSYLLEYRHLALLYQKSSTFLEDYMRHFERMIRTHLPDVYQHMQNQGFVVAMYGIEWFTTLFSLSTKLDLACAIFDLFFVGLRDTFLRVGLAILKILESQLLCMSFEDFLREFKPLVRRLDPYQVILETLAFPPNPCAGAEDTTVFITREQYQQSALKSAVGAVSTPPRAYNRHRALPPELINAVSSGDFDAIASAWHVITEARPFRRFAQVLANEILHISIWFGQVSLACYALEQCGADANRVDETGLTPLHFSVIRNQPDMVRLLILVGGAIDDRRGGRWSGTSEGLTPHETSLYWKFNDTNAARLVLETEVCLFCNARFDRFTLDRATCIKCKWAFCSQAANRRPCIERHHCPPVQIGESMESCGEGSSVIGSDTLDLSRFPAFGAEFRVHEGDNTSALSSTQLSNHSVSISDSSSLACVQSPMSLISDSGTYADDHDHSTIARVSRGSSSSSPRSVRVDGWNALQADPIENRHTQFVRIEFPDRPQWYCNAQNCHAVFSIFTTRFECDRCEGVFCSQDFDNLAQRCSQCSRSIARHQKS
ncbi:hypothetical protein PINS_up003793 [Pythium insidiosum]|nr:hypothetical protein PINS_up003793 [Pythium insidiosum]